MVTRIFSLWQLRTTVQFQLYLRLHNIFINQLHRQVQVSEYFMVLVITVIYQFQWKLILVSPQFDFYPLLYLDPVDEIHSKVQAS
jgi:hypothetical protein